MHPRTWCAIGGLAVFAWAGQGASAQARLRTLQVANGRAPAAGVKDAASITNASVTPQPLQFAASDPDLGSDPANSPATVSWVLSGPHTVAWTLTVSAAASSFSGCGTVPVSAITVRCASVSGGPGTCGAPFQLSTEPQTVASGRQTTANPLMAVIINFTFQDSWQYIAGSNSPCTLNLSYVIAAS